MTDRAFYARHGLVVNNNVLVANASTSRVGVNTNTPDTELTVNGSVNVYSSVTLANTMLVGNTTTGVSANSSTFTVQTPSANVKITPSAVTVGGVSSLNSTALQVGSNLVYNGTSVTVGNSTVNTAITSSAVTVGATIVNSVSTTSNTLFANTIQANSATVNGQVTAITYFSGNSTVNSTSNSTVYVVSDASSNVRANTTSIQVGSTVVVNTSALSLGSNVTVGLSTISVGNSTVNLVANSIGVVIGGTVVNSAGITAPASSVSTLLVTGSANVGATLRVAGDLIVTGTVASSGTSSGDLIPSSNSFALGNTTNRWIIYAVNTSIIGTLTVTGANTNFHSGLALLDSTNSRVGIGNTTPGSKLTVGGVIESTTGGVKFPDGTTQISASAFTIPGANTNITYNNSGALGADAGFTFNSTTKSVFANGSIVSNTAFYSLQSGTSSVPAFSFSSETNTGLYRSGTGEISLTGTGTVLGVFNSTLNQLTAALTIGNTTSNSLVNSTSISFNGTLSLNSTAYQGTANNAINLGGVASGSYLLSATAASTYAPLASPTFSGTATIPNISSGTPTLFTAQGGAEGGELHLAKAPTGSTWSGDLVIDVNANNLRIFESTGSNRGAFLDITQQGSQSRIVTEAAGTALLANNSSYLGGVAAASYMTTSATYTGTLTSSQVTTALTYVPVQQSTGTGQGSNAVKIGWSNSVNGGSSLRLTIDTTDFANTWPISISGTAANATLLAGVSAASYLLSSTAASTYAPLASPSFSGTASFNLIANATRVAAGAGAQGGQFLLTKSPTGSTLAGDAVIDTSGNNLRIFENGGSFRGVFVDLTAQGAQSKIVTEAAGTALFANSAAFLGSSSAASYLLSSTASGTYLTISSASATYLTISTAASTYAPTASPTFSGTFDMTAANVKSQTLTAGSTVNWNTAGGQIATVTLNQATTMAAPTNLKVQNYILHVIQDGTGSRTISWNSVFKFPAGIAPTLTAAAGSHDVFSFTSDGTNLYGTIIPDVR